MPKLDPLQSSFAGGEITPKLNARSDLDIFKQGVEELVNMLPLRHGPATRRQGTGFIAEYAGDTTGKLFTFHISPSQSFIVVISDDGNLNVNDENGQLLLDNIVLNPFFDTGLDDWVDDSEGQAGVVWANGVAGMGSSLVGREARLGQLLAIQGGQENNDHELRMVGEGSPSVALKIGTTLNGAEIAETTFVEGVGSFIFNPGGASAVWITFVYTGVEPLTGFWSLDAVRVSAIGALGVTFAHPWNASDISELQVALPPGEDTMFFTAPRVAQQELIYNAAADTWDFEPISFTSPPAVWTGNNFPATITFFQGRSWWGGSPDQPARFWASKSASIRDMTQGSVADDGMEFDLSRRGRIEWMEGIKNLLIGTENGEFIVTSEQGLIEPGDISVEQQSAYGSESTQAQVIGNQVLYLSSDGTKLRELDYSWTEDGWLSRDLSFPAEHMGLESPMREIHYGRDPESLIVCLTADGRLYICTYDPNSKFVGWSRAALPGGRIVSLTASQSRGSTFIWALVERPGVGVAEGKFYLERFSGLSTGRDFLDSSVVQLNDPPSTAVTGVVHLANETVSVSVDNATHPDITLDANGDGTLNFPGGRIVIGFTFTSRLKTLPMDPGGPGGGSSMGMRKRWNRIFVRLLDSALPLVNGERQPERTPSTPMNQTEPDRSQDVETRNFGWDQFAQVTVEQDLPRALTITALFGEFVEERL